MGFPATDGLEPLTTGLFGDLLQSGSLTLHRPPRKSGRPWEDNSLKRSASPSQFQGRDNPATLMRNPSVVHGLFYGPYPTVQRSHPAYPKALCKCPRHSKSQNLLLNQETLHPECHPRLYSQASGLFNTSMIYRPFTFTNLGRKCTFVPPRKLPCLVPRPHNPCVIKPLSLKSHIC